MKIISRNAALLLRIASVGAAISALAGCGEKYEKLMTDAAIATADRVCGVYRLVDAVWDGAPLDLDEDGIASESFLEECLAGNHLGLVATEEGVTGRVHSITYGSDRPVEMYLPFFHGEYSLSGQSAPGATLGDGSKVPLYSCESLKGSYSIREDGTLVLDFLSSQRRSAWYPETAFCDVWDISVTWDSDGDGDFILSGTTRFIDRISGNEVEGRETLRYHCISTKEKKKR